MTSRSRSISRVAAMAIDRTTSANNTVTCLYSAVVAAGVIGAPHLLQNLESGGSSAPHDVHDSVVAVSPPPPSPPGSTSISCHRGSAFSGRLKRAPKWTTLHFPLSSNLPLQPPHGSMIDVRREDRPERKPTQR